MPAKFVSLFVAQLFFPRLFVVQVSSFQESPGQWDVHLRRKRFAFALAARWKGASIDGAEAPVRSANPDKQRACCFSSTILANSVGEHLPCDSIQLLRPIVSNEENINSVTIAGSRTAFRRLVFFIKRDGRSRFFSQVDLVALLGVDAFKVESESMPAPADRVTAPKEKNLCASAPGDQQRVKGESPRQ